MTRPRLIALLVLIVAGPAAAATAVMWSAPGKPCFLAGDASYRFTDNGAADLTVRLDDHAAHPDLRLQIVDDAAVADFVLVDDGAIDAACGNSIEHIRLDNAARKPDLIVALSRAPAPHKIYVRSSRYTAGEAAALFAALWRNSHHAGDRTGAIPEVAARN
jgi:hypothetical protein